MRSLLFMLLALLPLTIVFGVPVFAEAPRVPVSGEGIVVAVKDNVFHVYLLEEKCIRIVYGDRRVAVGDYVKYRGYTQTTFTVVRDPITNRPITIGYVVFDASVSVVRKAVDLEVDGECGATYAIGEEVRISFKVPVTSRVRLVVIKPSGALLLLDRVLASGAYTIKGVIGEPPGVRTLVLEVWLPTNPGCPLYEDYAIVRVYCTYEAVSGADLEIQAVDVSPYPLLECSEGKVTATIVNVGEGWSKATRVVVVIADKIVGDADLPPIEPGGSSEVEVDVEVPCCSEGALEVMVDPDDLVVEVREDNNVYVVPDAVEARKPSLVATLLPMEVTATVNSSVSLVLSNRGEAEARSIRVEISPPPGLTVKPSSLNIDSIQPDSSVTIDLTVLAERAGRYELTVSMSFLDECEREWSESLVVTVDVAKRELELTVKIKPSEVTVLTPVVLLGHAPIDAAGLKLSVVLRLENTSWTKIGEVEVKADGSFSFNFTPKRAGSYDVGVRYKGDEVWEESLAHTSLKVRRIKASLNLEVPERVHAGREFVIRGVLEPARDAVCVIRLVAPDGSSLEMEVEVRDGIVEARIKLNQTGDWRIDAVVPGGGIYEDAHSSLIIRVTALRVVAQPAAVAIAVATGFAVSVATTLSVARRVVSSIAQRIRMTLEAAGIKPPHWLEELSNIYLEEVFKSATEKEAPPPQAWRLVTPSELKALIVSIGLMSLVFTYIESGGEMLNPRILDEVVVPVVAASLLIVLIDELSEALTSKVRGLWAEYAFWPHGAISMIVTGILFSSPFASPGRTVFSRNYPKLEKARLLLYKFLALMALAGFFAALVSAGIEVMGDSGLIATLALLFYSLFPVPPLPGYELASESKGCWLLVFLSSGTLYLASLLRILNPLVMGLLGAIALALLVAEALLSKLGGRSIVRLLVKARSK